MLKIKEIKILLFIVTISTGLFTFFYGQNNSITITEIVFKNDNISESFKGYKILQISDLHNKKFGNKQNKILSKIENINPDIIVITGDLIDSKNTNIDIAMDLIEGAINIAPIYYVSGNHEVWSGLYDDLKSKLENSGVVVLDNQKTEIFNDSNSIDIIGLSDTSFMESDCLDTLTKDNDNFKILLSHRPELFDIYSSSNVNLVFSGHAHGGQFRLPFIGGLVAPDQGFFPKLTECI
ncbi:MAG: metallophosphoesterase, partial [Peptostreptococcaceae bacterium]